jgi:hypothetical protein
MQCYESLELDGEWQCLRVTMRYMFWLFEITHSILAILTLRIVNEIGGFLGLAGCKQLPGLIDFFQLELAAGKHLLDSDSASAIVFQSGIGDFQLDSYIRAPTRRYIHIHVRQDVLARQPCFAELIQERSFLGYFSCVEDAAVDRCPPFVRAVVFGAVAIINKDPLLLADVLYDRMLQGDNHNRHTDDSCFDSCGFTSSLECCETTTYSYILQI